MSRKVPRRVVMSGFALPVAAAGIGFSAVPALARPGHVPGPGLPGTDVPSVGLPTFTEGRHDTVLTTGTDEALAGRGISFVPAPGSTAVPNTVRPSTRLILTVGSTALNLLVGAVHFDGGFTLTDDPDGSGGTDSSRLTFGSFTSQLADKVATSWLWRDGEPGDRIPALTYDLTNSTIDIDGSTLALDDYSLFLTEDAVAAIQDVFPQAPVNTTEPFAEGSAVGSFSQPAELPVS